MIKNTFKILAILITSTIYGQGCSDAGFCTLQDTKHVESFLSKHNSIAVGMGYGAGFEQVKIWNSYLEYGYTVNEKISLQTKLTHQNASGPFGTNSGLGDLFLTANYRLSTTDVIDFRFLVGAKFPLNNANAKNSAGVPLPMEYQNSLGTTDLVIGSSMVYDKKWDFSLAAQFPVANKNENQFSPIYYNNSTNFAQTTGFERKADALFRIGYNYQISDTRLSFKPSLLTIYHTGTDTYKDFLNNEMSIKGSDGLTVNGVLNTILSFKDNSQLELTLAAPFAVRDIRPDGLTRQFVVNLQYKIKF
jgi:hypothetical protein